MSILTRPDRRRTNPKRTTISAYIDAQVVASLDRLVQADVFANRSDVIEVACRHLVSDIEAASSDGTPDEAATT